MYACTDDDNYLRIPFSQAIGGVIPCHVNRSLAKKSMKAGNPKLIQSFLLLGDFDLLLVYKFYKKMFD